MAKESLQDTVTNHTSFLTKIILYERKFLGNIKECRGKCSHKVTVMTIVASIKIN